MKKFYARQGIDNATEEPVAIVAVLSKAFEEVTMEKASLKVTLFNDNLTAALKRVKAKRLSVGSHVNNPPGLYNTVLVKLIADFEVMKNPIANHLDNLDSLFSILMLLKIFLDNHSFSKPHCNRPSLQ